MQDPKDSKSCPRCRKPNLCQAKSDPEACWCMALPPQRPVPISDMEACLCPNCLKEVLLEHVTDENSP